MKKIFLVFLMTICLFSCNDDPVVAACDVPTGIIIENITTESAEIRWTPGKEDSSYEIVIGPSGLSIGEGLIMTNLTNSTTVTGLAGGTDYDFFVRAICNDQSTSDWSQVQTFTTVEACSTIISTDVTNITQTAALISWEYLGNFPISFIIEYGEQDFIPGNGAIAETSITNIPLMNLMQGIDYHYYLTAKCTGDNLGERVGPFAFSTLD